MAQPACTRPAPGTDRAGRRRHPRPSGHQGVRPAGHGPARAGDRGDRLREVGVPAHLGARAGAHPLARAAEHGAGRLQGRRHLRGDVRDASRLGRDHEPRRGADPRRPHAGRPVGRDGAPTGAAPRLRQLRIRPRLRAGARRRRGPRPASLAVHRRRRVLRDAVRQARVHRPLRRDRPSRPVPRTPPAAGVTAPRGGAAARTGVAPVLPGRPAHVLGPGVAVRARCPGRLRAAADARPGVPQARPVDAPALQGGVRLGAAVGRTFTRGDPRRDRVGPRDPALDDHRGARARTTRAESNVHRSPSQRRPATTCRCSTSR
jgi:hypothetical protein